jgi:DNA-binding MurR/RpiR family transcriptional regulator
VKNKITTHYASLTPQQKKIANYILDNLNDVIFNNVSYLAEKADTSVASVIRFARALGYEGFPQLKDDLIEYYRKQMDIGGRFKRTIESLPEGNPSYSDITQSEIACLQRSINELEQKEFERAVELMCAAKHLYIFGNGSNECLANNLFFRLNRLGMEVVQLSESGHILVEKLFRVEPEDVIVVFDFFTPSLDTTRIHELKQRNNYTIVSVTDTGNPQMIRNSEVVLNAKRGSSKFFNSHVVPTAIINALVIAVARNLGEPAVVNLRKLSKLREKYSYPPLINSIRLGKDPE